MTEQLTSLSSWKNPTVIVALLGILGTAYAAFMVQRVKIEALEKRISVVESDFTRREVVVLELKAINVRLDDLRRAVEETKK